jgi:hypothetical protein
VHVGHCAKLLSGFKKQGVRMRTLSPAYFVYLFLYQ